MHNTEREKKISYSLQDWYPDIKSLNGFKRLPPKFTNLKEAKSQKINEKKEYATSWDHSEKFNL